MHRTPFLLAALAGAVLAGLAQAQRGGRDPASMLSRFDANKDGKLTKDEVQNERMWRRLATADKNGDGTINQEELEAMPQRGRGRGRGRNGGRGRGQESGEAAWKFLSGKYDADKDGKLTKEEYGRDEATFARLDRDGDGVVTAADWQVEAPRGRRGGRRGARGRGAGGRAEQPAAPKAGDSAPDFELTLVTDAKQKVKLSSFADKQAVALIFGSCT
ncbi:MAG: hypothetical protein AB8H80_00080 [Planctomycetota bacterium]